MVTLAHTIIILITGLINPIKPEEGSKPNLLVLALEVLLIPKLELFPLSNGRRKKAIGGFPPKCGEK